MTDERIKELANKWCLHPTDNAWDEVMGFAYDLLAEQGIDAVNISAERVDETAKGEHEPWPSVQCTCGAIIYFKYTPPISDYHEGWEEGFKAAKCKHEPVAYVNIEDFPEQVGVPSIKWCKKPTQGPLYTAPKKREWVGLTEVDIYEAMDHEDEFDFAKAIEAKLKEKNGE